MTLVEIAFDDKQLDQQIDMSLNDKGEMEISITNIINMQDESCAFTLTPRQVETLRLVLNNDKASRE